MPYYRQRTHLFSGEYLTDLRGAIFASPYFAVNNLNRDFVDTKGFSIVFQRSHLPTVAQQFPVFQPYLDQTLDAGCNAFYLNPLLLRQGSRVDPHIDRSLRSYCKTILPPLLVSVLYVQVPADLLGGELVLCHRKQQVACIAPQTNTLLHFQGDLTHSVKAMQQGNERLSLVCEQYFLEDKELQEIPEFAIETRASKSVKSAGAARKRQSGSTADQRMRVNEVL